MEFKPSQYFDNDLEGWYYKITKEALYSLDELSKLKDIIVTLIVYEYALFPY